MQCPNCNKEAINVNGKYVCLDCGIEISPNQPASVPEPTPIITQNSGVPLSTNPVATVPAPAPAEIQLQQENEIPVNSVPEPVADTIVVPAAPIREEIESQLAQSLPDIAMTNNQEGDNQGSPMSGPLPDFPGLDDVQPALPPIPAEEAAPVVLAPSPVPAPDPIAPTVAPVSAVTPVPTADSVSDFFQPSQVEISNIDNNSSQPNSVTATEPQPTPAVTDPSTIVVPNMPQGDPVSIPNNENPTIPSITPVVDPLPAQPEPIPTLAEQPGPVPSLDDMLGSSPAVPSFQPNVPAPQVVEPVQDVLDPPQPNQENYPSAPSAIPGPPINASGQIPSYESVFGNQNNNQPIVPPQQAAKSGVGGLFSNKKLIFIIAGVVALLLFGGIGFVLLSGGGNDKQAEKTNQVDQALLSQNVQEAMESDVQAVVKYEQTIDFSDVKLADSAPDPENPSTTEGDITKSSVVNKGVWKTNSDGDVSIDSSINKVGVKKVYIDAEKETYGITTSATAWTKQQGKLLGEVPDFYGADTRAKIFYVNQAESVTSLGKEEIDGTDYNKYQILPKPEYITEVIKQSNPLFEKLDYEEVIVENLNVFVWLDDQNKIVKVEVKGDVGISGGSFEENSTISIDSIAEYSYQDTVEIEKPSTSASNVITPQNNTAQIDKEVAPSVIKATEVNSKKDGGRG